MGNILLTDRDFTNVHGYSAFHLGNEFAVDAQQVVYAGGAVNANIKLAQLGKEQAGLGLDMSRENIRFMALGQYLDLQKLQNREKVIARSRETYGVPRELVETKINKWIEGKFDKGLAIAQEMKDKKAQQDAQGIATNSMMPQQ